MTAATLALAAAAAYVALLAFKTFGAWRYVRTYPAPAAADVASVAILQPILSGDPDLGAALDANVRALPQARFVWLIDDDDATAHALCAALRAQHPAVRIEIASFGPAPDGVNPKLHKLALANVDAPIQIVLDDDTRLPRTSLDALCAALARAQLATGLPCYLDDGRWPSRLLAQFVNNQAAMTYLSLACWTPPPTINGMCYALPRATLRTIGGFAPLTRHLTDDLAVARRVHDAGGAIEQTPYPQFIRTSVSDFAQYARLMHRWFLFALLLLRRMPRRLRAAIFMLHGLPPLLLWAALIATAVAPQASTVTAAALLLALRAACIAALQWRTTGAARHRPLLSLLAELLQPLHLGHALVRRRIAWRKRRYRVFDNDRFVSA